ncbi:MAG: Tex family protein [Candidatus Onthovivens sp.]|nr:Tex family protein [Candidatus Onthovivens sp.]MDY4937084.1 Tex family protein [Candidatus Onthovivens sp.]
MNISEIISEELSLKLNSVDAAIKLIDEGNTIPFIARYRKEATNYLTDNDLRKLEERLIYLRKLDERIKTVLNSINEQGKLTPELEEAINNCRTLSEVEDLYRPYKPKKRTRASIAKEKGLEPLAKAILEGQEDILEFAKSFINEEKKVNSVEEAISGAKDIIAENLSDVADYRIYIKKVIYKNGKIISKEIKKDEKDTYKDYSDYQESIKTIKNHRILALNRGEKEKCLKVNLDYDFETIFNFIVKKEKFLLNVNKDILFDTLDDSLKRLILPSVENEIRNELFEKAEDSAIEIFKKNLYQLLMYPPIKNINVLGFDPGFRTGCKYALVDIYGNPKKIGQVFITSNSNNEVEKGIKEVTELLKNNRVDYIALGNGTASRESETILRKIILDNKFNTKLFIVNESGASVYSASKLGEEEFPTLSVEKRSAISLARRLQDPLAELVKIDPKAIGVGQYQHDMDEGKLDFALNNVVEDCVNLVGVNVNTASISLLKYVSGINKSLAQNIYEHRVKNGPFKNREQLKEVKKMGDKAFEQCAGFLRIIDGNNKFDNTGIHPESYEIAKKILDFCKVSLENNDFSEINLALDNFNKNKFLAENKVGEATLDDIINELRKPGRDVREDVEIVELNNDVKDIKDLKVGMVLNGTVRNIMDFGIFVDINVHQDGLVHISELANKFVRHPSELYSINDIVKVKVIGVDIDKKRISLSIKQVA